MTEDQVSFHIGFIAIVLSLFGLWKIAEIIAKFL